MTVNYASYSNIQRRESLTFDAPRLYPNQLSTHSWPLQLGGVALSPLSPLTLEAGLFLAAERFGYNI